MGRSLLETIFLSEKRKNLLLLLRDGPRKMEEILPALDVSRHALLPQIKILSDNGLIIKEKDVCRLSEIGEVIVEDMVPLVGTFALILLKLLNSIGTSLNRCVSISALR
jgi:predicted transcriptional regulator